ncbi:hypothetical protein PUN28_004913 [Cardiocondyla obscurior]|uniref:snRNA-activating protein complex subunit 3 n=1 Tax=Cardiocondyla obscurior TaxID=286306 RepID=A0AAW2GES8_9HYME
MDKIYKVYNRQASSKISLQNYFEKYSNLIQSLKNYDNDQLDEEKIFKLMDTDLSQARTLLIKQYCSIDNLTLPIEAVKDEKQDKNGHVKLPETISDNVPLETLKILKNLSKETLHKPRNQIGTCINYPKSTVIHNTSMAKPGKDFLVYIRVYEPFKSHPRSFKYKTGIPVLKLKSVISIFGCQTLYQLRQKIICQSDLSITKEISEKPHQKLEPMAKTVYKSGFFYIEDTFYNDTSDPLNVDYSSTILEWAEARGIGPFKVDTMNTQIKSLCTKFGFPWVYQHQGSCEHLIVLSDARLANMDDELMLCSYPRIERIIPPSGKNCIYCGIFNVHWIVMDHDRIPHDVSYFCSNCFISYNYVDGKKIGNFKAYSYPCIPNLMLRMENHSKSKESVKTKKVKH